MTPTPSAVAVATVAGTGPGAAQRPGRRAGSAGQAVGAR
jgi:hypothetical protein